MAGWPGRVRALPPAPHCPPAGDHRSGRVPAQSGQGVLRSIKLKVGPGLSALCPAPGVLGALPRRIGPPGLGPGEVRGRMASSCMPSWPHPVVDRKAPLRRAVLVPALRLRRLCPGCVCVHETGACLGPRAWSSSRARGGGRPPSAHAGSVQSRNDGQGSTRSCAAARQTRVPEWQTWLRLQRRC